MEKYYISLEADFKDKEDIEDTEITYNLSIALVTKFHAQSMEQYYGPDVYVFIGSWQDIIDFLVDPHGYGMDDLETLVDYIKDIKTIQI